MSLCLQNRSEGMVKVKAAIQACLYLFHHKKEGGIRGHRRSDWDHSKGAKPKKDRQTRLPIECGTVLST